MEALSNDLYIMRSCFFLFFSNNDRNNRDETIAMHLWIKEKIKLHLIYTNYNIIVILKYSLRFSGIH